MQDEQRQVPFFAIGLKPLIILLLLPEFQHVRFALRQIRPHWKISFRQLQCLLVVVLLQLLSTPLRTRNKKLSSHKGRE